MAICVTVDKGAAYLPPLGMARPPRRAATDVAVHVLTHALGSDQDEEGGGSLGGELWLANRFSVVIDDPGSDYLVTMVIAASSGRLVAEEVTAAARPGGPPVTATGLRTVTVDAYLAGVRRELMKLEGGLLVMRRQVDGNLTTWSGVAPGDWGRFEERQRRRRSTVDALPLVAELYKKALESLDSDVAAAPTQYVADTLHYSRGHVSRLLSQARDAGLLGPAPVGRAGELTTMNAKEDR